MKLSSASPQVVTGATGFVGSSLVLELLGRTDATVLAIVRAENDEAALDRLQPILRGLIDEYELGDDVHDAVSNRLKAVAGDIEQPLCGMSSETISEYSGADLWHSAASLRYQDRHLEDINRTNVTGTQNVVALAKTLETGCLNMISTAYVAGSRQGTIMAEAAVSGAENNHYERSKVKAEGLVVGSGLKYRVMRPGVVIGHSRTKHTLSQDGFYGLTRNLVKYRGALNRAQEGLGDGHVATIVATPEGGLDLVPVDLVAGEAVDLFIAEAEQGFYHLTNATPPRISDVLGSAFAAAGFPPPKYADSPEGFSDIDRKLYDRMTFYNSYLVNPKTFDRTTVETALHGSARPGVELDEGTLRTYCDWYLDRYVSERAPLAGTR